ncbi:Piso0_000753 [Millerozyma farinosa CBS 7064]|uniref:Piso0_000753 protein n=1 Tax=Pichia sorbitophila (strain ATCC MYA-4447 / BCRC 22081 / CBS 7064 / NBRC 10061 / NRRL Y-12695) TaxID=559304 RepID=G8YRF1_PICSO|nr:Piso0_000753 [Millerozyma farinosa CBS 7064]
MMQENEIIHDTDPTHISSVVDKLSRQEGDKKLLIEFLSNRVPKRGLNQDDFYKTIELIFDTGHPVYLTASEKKKVIKRCLIPDGTFKLSKDLIYRIISCVGIPQNYFKNGKMVKSKRLNTSVQVRLLEWLVCSLHFFGEDVFRVLNRMLTTLTHYLSFEYPRPYIARLITVSILGTENVIKTYFNETSTHNVESFKPWHVQFIVDLYCKFPMDDHLRCLLYLLKTLKPNLNLHKFTTKENINMHNLGQINPKALGYPDFEYLENTRAVRDAQDSTNEKLKAEQERVIQDELKSYSFFSSNTKRRKYRDLNNNIDFNLVDIRGNNTSAANPINFHSLTGVIENSENLKYVNVNSIFDESHIANKEAQKYKLFFFILKNAMAKNSNSLALKKVDYFVRLSLSDKELTEDGFTSLVDNIALFLDYSSNTLVLSSVVDFILFRIDSPISGNINTQKRCNLDQRLKLLKYLPYEYHEDLSTTFTNEFFTCLNELKLDKIEIEKYILKFIQVINFYFINWYKKISKTGGSYSNLFISINKIFPVLYCFLDNGNVSGSLNLKLSLMLLLRMFRQMDVNVINTNISMKSILLPPSLFYNLLMSLNPLVCSEVCGYLSFCKSGQIKDADDDYKIMQNTYITDTINFLWREKAFVSDKNAASAMFFDHYLSKQIGQFNVFHFFESLTINRIGNLFHNPAWSFIVTQHVRDLEDKDDKVSIRNAGPLTEESIEDLRLNNEVNWLPFSYDEIRLEVLRFLDSVGYEGLADLMFSSLKSLIGKRKSNAK